MLKKWVVNRKVIRETIINLLENSTQYECINEAKSGIGGHKLNKLPTIKSCKEKCLLFEDIDW